VDERSAVKSLLRLGTVCSVGMAALMAGRDNWRELSFNGRSAVVTGAARGIARAISYRLAGLGARTVIWDRDGAVAERTAIEFRDLLNSQGRPHHLEWDFSCNSKGYENVCL
jgi:shikimate 5-dehydrogenase